MLPNVVLATVAGATTAGAVWVWVRRASAAAAPALLALVLFFVGIFGGPLWEWSKFEQGAGLPQEIKAVPFAQSTAASAFLWAAVGAGVAAFLLRKAERQSSDRPRGQSRNVSIILIVATIVALVIWLVGSGPSVLSRDTYLASDGILLLLLIGWPLGLLSSMITLVLSVYERDPLVKLGMWSVAAVWYVAMLSVGTRMAIAYPLVAAIVLIADMVYSRRIRVSSSIAAVALLGLGALTFSVVLAARLMPHGLLNLPDLFSAVFARSDNFADALSTPVKRLSASIFQAYPLTERSTQYDLLDVLLANANPLPGSAQPASLERFWPYSWVPLSFVGTWYGATGWFGQVVLFCFMGWVTGTAISNFQRSRFTYASFAVIVLVLGLGILSIEYSSRNVWRVVSIAVIVLVVSYLVRERSTGPPSIDVLERKRMAAGRAAS
jgi:hypothetical protein